MAEPTLRLIPSGFKDGTLYSVIPQYGLGDFDAARASFANRINEDGYTDTMANDVPRIDYADGGCPVLLLEDASTNKITWPFDYGDIYWTKTGASVDDNGGAYYPSPFVGSNVARKLVEDVSLGQHRVVRTVSGLITGDMYSSIIIVKPIDRALFVQLFDGANTSRVTVGIDGTISGGIGIYSYKNLPDGFLEITLTINAISGTNTTLYIYLLDELGSASYQGDGISGVYLAGAQLEEGTGSSFINDPTAIEGSEVTRANDNVSGATYTGDSESGVFFVGYESNTILDGTREFRINGDIDNYISIGQFNDSFYCAINLNGSSDTYITGLLPDVYYKIAFRWESGSADIFIDGTYRGSIVISGTFTSGVLTDISMDRIVGKLKQLQTLPYLTDEEMKILTTP